jgi:hypothetical protein
MNGLATWVDSGRVIDLLLLVIGIEIAALALWKRARFAVVLLGLLPGLCLMLALREALGDQDWRMIVFWITASLPFHLADVRQRLK